MAPLRCAAVAFSSNLSNAKRRVLSFCAPSRPAMIPIFRPRPSLRLTVVCVLDVEARCAPIELNEQERTVEADLVEGSGPLEQGALFFIAGRIDIGRATRRRHGHDHGHRHGPVRNIFETSTLIGVGSMGASGALSAWASS